MERGEIVAGILPSVVKNTNSELGRVVVVIIILRMVLGMLGTEFPDVERVLFEDNFGFAGDITGHRDDRGRIRGPFK
ncbi:MAG: hypothetical protein ACLTZT_14875 [Butyricimonas faecalis]